MEFAEYDNVAEPFLASVRADPAACAMIYDDERISYGAMNEQVNRFAHWLAEEARVVPGDRVAYLLPNCPVLMEVYYAAQKIGAVTVPLNFKLIGREIGYLVNASGARVLVAAEQFAPLVEEAQKEFGHGVRVLFTDGKGAAGNRVEEALANCSTDEPTLFHDGQALSRIQYTGGSTGLPKGAARTHRADLVELASVTQSNGMAAHPGSIALVQCPLEHHGGHSWFTSIFATRSTLVICAAFNAERILRDIAVYGVTHMILLPPTTYERLCRCPVIDQYDTSSVRLVQSAAGATTRAMIEGVLARFPNAVLNYGWGQSESGTGTSLRITRAMVAEDSPLLGSVGRPMPYATLKVVDEEGRELPAGEVGEALIKTDAAMAGYYGQPELTEAVFTEDGWLRTGDMMSRDEEGYFFMRARKKDMVKSGGENVFVAEVENVLRSHPAIDDCLVFGTEDPVLDEAVAAVVQPAPGALLTAADVQDHCKRTLASYKKPRYVVFMDDMGRDSAGKVRKAHIEAYFNERKAQAAPRLHEKLSDHPEVYLIQVPFSEGTPIGFTNAYLVRGGERDLLVDTGTSHEASYSVLTRALDELGVDPERMDIFLTHFHIDHLGLAAAVASPSTRVYLSAPDEVLFRARGEASYRGTMKQRLTEEGFPDADLDVLATTDARLIPRAQWPMPERFCTVGDGDVLTVGDTELEVMATPGHTPGHLCLVARDGSLAFVGDHVLENSSPNMAPFPNEADSLGDYLASLERLDERGVQWALMGHGPVDPKADPGRLHRRIRWLLAHHRERLDEIEKAVAACPGATGTELARSIHWNIPYRQWEDIPIIQRWIIVGETAAHLDHLLAQGRVSLEKDEGTRHYFPATGRGTDEKGSGHGHDSDR